MVWCFKHEKPRDNMRWVAGRRHQQDPYFCCQFTASCANAAKRGTSSTTATAPPPKARWQLLPDG
jgi:hypothetical protein